MISKQTRVDKIKTQIQIDDSNQKRQISMKKKSFNENNNNEFQNQQLVQIFQQRQMFVIHSIAFEISHSTIRDLSNEIIIDLTRLFDAMLNEQLDRRLFSARRVFEKNSEVEKTQRFERFWFSITRSFVINRSKQSAEQTAKQFAKQSTNQFVKQFANQFAEKLAKQSISQSTNEFAARLFESKLKIENVDFFDSIQKKKSKSFIIIVHSSKHVFYKDVYVFVERLQNMIKQYNEKIIENLVIECLRDDVLEWYTIEIDDEYRNSLRNVKLDNWSRIFINRFKTRVSVALNRLINQKYSLNDIKRKVTSRTWFLQMLRYVKTANFLNIFNQLILIWNRFDVLLRRDIFESNDHIIIKRFLENIDDKISIWYEMIDRQTDRQIAYQRQQQFFNDFFYRQQYINRDDQNDNIKILSKTSVSDKSRQIYLVEIASQNTLYEYHLNEIEKNEFDENEMSVN